MSDAPLDRAAVFEIVRASLADILEIEPSTINEGDSFAEDLHLGSLELIELVEAIEEEFGQRVAGFRITFRRGPGRQFGIQPAQQDPCG
mgnify:CR=1 FL=1